MSSVGEEIQAEIKRVRDVVLPAYLDIGPAGAFAAALMRQSLDKATKALVEQDVAKIISAYMELKEYNT